MLFSRSIAERDLGPPGSSLSRFAELNLNTLLALRPIHTEPFSLANLLNTNAILPATIIGQYDLLSRIARMSKCSLPWREDAAAAKPM